MKIEQWMIDYIEGKAAWDADLKQEMYLRIADMEFRIINKGYLISMYNALRNNEHNKENRRREIEADNIEAIRTGLGMEAEDSDPAELVMMVDEAERKLSEMSPLLADTLEKVVLDGDSYEEVALAEGTTANVIYQRVWQAKKQLGE